MSITAVVVIGVIGVAVGAAVFFIDRKSTTKAVSTPAPVVTPHPVGKPIDVEPMKPGEKLP